MTPTRSAGSRRPQARAGRRGTALRRAALGAMLLLGATGCSASWIPNFGFPNPVTDQGQWVLTLWKGSCIAALIIGGLVWGLMGWSVVFFRKNTEDLPPQVRYNLPIEVLYTVLPVIIISVLFYYTAIVESREDKLSAKPGLTVGVIGFQWNWQFNYVGQGVQVTGRPGEPPKLVLPADETVRFVETSPDVIHSFWVPAFLFKRDVVPGRDNQFEITIRRPGTYIGRCAELCGVDHDRMDFFVQVLPKDQFASWLTSVKAQTPSSQALGAGDRSTGTPQALGPASWLVTEPQSRSASSSGPTRSIVSVGSAW